MSFGVPLASGKSEIFEALLWFMPEWVQLSLLALAVLVFLVVRGVKLKRKIDHRRALRNGTPAPVPAQRSGADFLGPYAPQARPSAAPAAAEPSGADFLGSYAPQQARRDG